MRPLCETEWLIYDKCSEAIAICYFLLRFSEVVLFVLLKTKKTLSRSKNTTFKTSTLCQNSGTCLLDNTCAEKETPVFDCVCTLGYTGTLCEIEVNECDSSPCQGISTCNNLIGRFVCTCQKGLTGVSCEINIDDCSMIGIDSPCQNGGICIDGLHDFHCECPLCYQPLPGNEP